MLNHLFLSFYILEARQKKDYFDHKELVDTIIPKIIGVLLILFFYILNGFLFLLSKINIQVSLREYKGSIIILLLVISFLGIYFFKKKVLKKYPECIDLKSFDQEQIKFFKWTLYCVITIIFVPVIILSYFLIKSMN